MRHRGGDIFPEPLGGDGIAELRQGKVYALTDICLEGYTEVKSLRRTLRKLLERNGAWSEDRCLIALAEVGSEQAG